MGRVKTDVNENSKPPLAFQKEEDGKQLELTKKGKILTAVALFCGNIAFGCAFSAYDPVLTSLQTKYETDDTTISKVFPIMAGCYMVGALLGGFMYNHVNRQFAAIIIQVTVAIMMFLTPHCPSLALFLLMGGVLGVCFGSYDAAQFVWMVEMMRSDCAPYLQAQKLFLAVGMSLPALVLAPFLDKRKAADVFVQDANANVTSFKGEPQGGNDDDGDDKLFIPFTIFGGLVSVAAICQILLFIFFRYHAPPPEVIETEKKLEGNDQTDNDKPFIRSWSWPKLRLVVLSCVFFAANQGMADSMTKFFSKFEQNSELHLSESEAAYVLTGMTGGLIAGRVLATIAVLRISPKLIIVANLVLVSVANVLLIGWSTRFLPVLWASSILFGLGFSSSYASFYAFIERHLHITNCIGSLMLFWSATGASVCCLVVGSFIEKSPIVLGYVGFLSIVLLLVSFSLASYFTRKNKTRY